MNNIEHFEDEWNIFEPIVSPIITIGKVFVSLQEASKQILNIFVKIIDIIMSLFQPDKLINDIIYGFTTGITTMITSFISNILNIFSEQNKTSNNDNDIYSKKNKLVCTNPTLLNLIILIACPPLAILRSKGIRAFMLILICGFMTYYMYYFPGLLFAALHIMC